jgi:hypothetical protein
MTINDEQAFVRLKFDRGLGNGENVGDCQAQADKPGTVSVQTRHASST